MTGLFLQYVLAQAGRCKRLAAVWLLGLAALGLSGCETGGNPEFVSDDVASSDITEPSPLPEAGADYRLQFGDVLEVKFTYASEYDQEVPIRPDGKIALRGVGEIEATGRTPADLSELLTQRYAARLRRPELAVIVTGFSPQKIYVGGEVRTPRSVVMRGPLTALQAIMEVGGFTDSAEPRNIVVLRDNGDATPGFMVLNLNERLTEPRKGSDVLLASRDIVFVPKSRIAKLNQFVNEYIDKLVPISKNLSVTYIFGDTDGN